MSIKQVFLIRHGETEWNLSDRHTGTTGLPVIMDGAIAFAIGVGLGRIGAA